MVAGAFPILKLSVLLFRQLSRPISNYIVDKTKTHPYFKHYVCIPPARLYNWCEAKIKMQILKLKSPVKIQVLDEKAAVELGADLLGELLVFVMAATALIAELSRQKWCDEKKERASRQEMANLVACLKQLAKRIEQNGVYIQEISDMVMHNKFKDEQKIQKDDTHQEIPLD